MGQHGVTFDNIVLVWSLLAVVMIVWVICDIATYDPEESHKERAARIKREQEDFDA